MRVVLATTGDEWMTKLRESKPASTTNEGATETSAPSDPKSTEIPPTGDLPVNVSRVVVVSPPLIVWVAGVKNRGVGGCNVNTAVAFVPEPTVMVTI